MSTSQRKKMKKMRKMRERQIKVLQGMGILLLMAICIGLFPKAHATTLLIGG